MDELIHQLVNMEWKYAGWFYLIVRKHVVGQFTFNGRVMMHLLTERMN